MVKDNPEVMKRRVNRWREKNRERARELDKADYRRNRHKRLAYNKRYNQAKKKENSARSKANNTDIPMVECKKCGGKDNLVKHHPDYNQPLFVIILCIKCHNRLHKKFFSEEEIRAIESRPGVHGPQVERLPLQRQGDAAHDSQESRTLRGAHTSAVDTQSQDWPNRKAAEVQHPCTSTSPDIDNQGVSK